MLFSEPLASLITFVRMSLIKFYLNSQRMSDSQQSTNVRFFLSHNWIKRIKFKKKSVCEWGPNTFIWPCFRIFE